MDMKCMVMLQFKGVKNIYRCVFNIYYKGESIMFKFLAKVAEKYAKATNTACMFWLLHQPKMPESMMKKD